MISDVLRGFKRTLVLQVRGDAGRPEGMVFDPRLDGSLTKCYHCFAMPDDLVIFVRCDTSAEKRAFASAAKRRGTTLSRFARQAMAACAGFNMHDKLCGHCGSRLIKGNRSGFCRKCLRTIGIKKLQNLHPR